MTTTDGHPDTAHRRHAATAMVHVAGIGRLVLGADRAGTELVRSGYD